MYKKWKRILSVVLAALLLVGAAPTVIAADSETDPEGDSFADAYGLQLTGSDLTADYSGRFAEGDDNDFFILQMPNADADVRFHVYSDDYQLVAPAGLSPQKLEGVGMVIYDSDFQEIGTASMGARIYYHTIAPGITIIDFSAAEHEAEITLSLEGNKTYFVKLRKGSFVYSSTVSYKLDVTCSVSNTEQGVCGDDMQWSFDAASGTLTIAGMGAMWDWASSGDEPWSSVRSDIKTVSVGNGVTNIGQNAFRDCDNLVSVTIPDSVTSIGWDAFYGCSSLTSVTIPDSVTTISGAFTACSSLASVTIGNGVTSIGNYTFDGCKSLTSVTIPNGVTSIGNGAFSVCSSLTSVTIPVSVTSIGQWAFYGCSALRDVYYTGSQEQWSAIKKAANGDNSLLNATLHFNPASVTLTGIAVRTQPTKTTYTVGESFDQSGLTLTATYSDGSTQMVTSGFTCSGFSSASAGTKTVTVTYQGMTVTFTVTVNPASVTLTGIAVRTQPTKTTYTVGESFDQSGLTLTATYSDGSTETVTSGFTCSGFSSASAGTKTITVTYQGKTATFTVTVASAIYSGECGTNVTWTLDTETGVLTISGTGAMEEYLYFSSAPWYDNKESVKTVMIGNGVTSIGEHAFWNCESLTSVTIPDSVTSIGKYAFGYCKSLTSVTIPDSVISVGDHAFHNCESLTSVTIGNGVTSIGEDSFEDCTSLTSVTIPDSVTSIRANTFCGCTSLVSVTIPGSVTSIGGFAFYKCTSLTSVTIGNGVASIGHDAFGNCTSLVSVTIPDSVTSIGDWAFYFCLSLTSVKIPDSVTSIGENAFHNCESLTSVTIGNGVTSIGIWAFRGCASLTSVTIPDSVTSIGRDAFEYCRSLTSVTIPSGVTSIGEYAFYGCSALCDVYYTGSQSQWDAIGIGDYNDPLLNASLHFIPASAIYSGECGLEGDNLLWTLNAVTGELSITGTGDMPYYPSTSSVPWYAYRSLIRSVTIGSGVISIYDYSFYGCENLTNITIADSVAGVSRTAFEGSAYYNNVYNWTNGVLYIGRHLIAAKGTLSGTYTVASGTKCIGRDAFSGCTSLTGIVIPDGVTSIGNRAFSGCTSLAAITLPDSVTRIGFEVFSTTAYYNNKGNWTGYVLYIGHHLVNTNPVLSGAYTVASGTKSLAAFAFASCENLTRVTIPDGVTGIGDSAFAGCTRLAGVTIPDSVTYLGNSMFYLCANLSEFTIPNGVTRIDVYMFMNCTSLASVTIPAGVTRVGNHAFSGCSALRDVYYTGSQAQWNAIRTGFDNAPLLNAALHLIPAPSQRIPGDADGNGQVTLIDAALISRYLVGGWGVTIDTDAADVDASGTVTLIDAALISRYLVGGWGVVLR